MGVACEKICAIGKMRKTPKSCDKYAKLFTGLRQIAAVALHTGGQPHELQDTGKAENVEIVHGKLNVMCQKCGKGGG